MWYKAHTLSGAESQKLYIKKGPDFSPEKLVASLWFPGHPFLPLLVEKALQKLLLQVLREALNISKKNNLYQGPGCFLEPGSWVLPNIPMVGTWRSHVVNHEDQWLQVLKNFILTREFSFWR